MTTAPSVLISTWSGGLFAVRSGAIAHEIPSGVVAGLTADGSGGALAIVGGGSLCRRSATGRWITLASSPAELVCCAALGDAVFAGTNDARVLRLDADGALTPLAGFDHVAGRETWYAGAALIDGRWVGPPLGARSMCATSDHSTLLVNIHVGGIPRSIDSGESWTPTIDIDCDVHQVCAHPRRPELVAAATGVGLALSRDAGATWTTEHHGLHARHCTAVAFVGEDVFVSAATDHFAQEGAIYRRAIAGSATLQPVDGSLPRWLDGICDTGNIAARDGCVAVADRGGHVYLSHDRGGSWERVAEGLPPPSGVLIC